MNLVLEHRIFGMKPMTDCPESKTNSQHFAFPHEGCNGSQEKRKLNSKDIRKGKNDGIKR